MFELIGKIIKYSVLTITILVLSHIVQVRGRTISQHVEYAMNWLGNGGPTHEATRAAREITSSVKAGFNNVVIRTRGAGSEPEISNDDQKRLNSLIQHTQQK